MKEPWYIKSFQEDYLTIYAHRTDEAARAEIKDIIQILELNSPATVLDLCCGNGRHSRALTELGFEVTGIDLSKVLLEQAELTNTDGKIRYSQCDVRETPFVEEFNVVLNLFTSFGYFDKWEENKKIFLSIATALKPSGVFLVDFLNPGYVQKHLVPYSERRVEDLLIKETRRIEGKKVIKQIDVLEGNQQRTYEEQVNLFTLAEMKKMIEETGLHITDVYGDLQKSKFDEGHSPRMIITGNK